MPRFIVSYTGEYSLDIPVCAENEDEARKLADELYDGSAGNDIRYYSFFPNGTDIMEG